MGKFPSLLVKYDLKMVFCLLHKYVGLLECIIANQITKAPKKKTHKKRLHPPKFDIAPEKWRLEDEFPFRDSIL